jgi:hypothetical protein
MNLYAYVADSPLNATDPSGLSDVSDPINSANSNGLDNRRKLQSALSDLAGGLQTSCAVTAFLSKTTGAFGIEGIAVPLAVLSGTLGAFGAVFGTVAGWLSGNGGTDNGVGLGSGIDSTIGLNKDGPSLGSGTATKAPLLKGYVDFNYYK